MLLTNLGAIYKDLGNLDQALSSTLKSLELNPDNATAHMNLGGIHKDLGNIDKALSSTLKSLELKPNNPGAINKISELIGQINISEFNSYDVTKAYELALNQTNISHRKLTRVFLQVFLPIIQKASAQAPIISESNQALKALAGDWRFLKSMTLIIPPNAEVERFLTRLRKELLNLAIQGGTIPPPLKPLIESLAAQCFLNEYVYSTSKEEVAAVSKLVEAAANSQEYINQYLALIGCYIAIHTIGISSELINNYPTHDDSSKELISTQFTEPLLEKEIRNSLPKTSKITDTTSQLVQKMYEENPYPRFKFSDYTESELASPACIFIKLETTRKNLTFSEELKSLTATPKVLIAGCGTGNQIIGASRYKNAKITAIDLSSSSLSYAIRKTKECRMDKVLFKQMDLLHVANLGEIFDVIECGGVLHHMHQPSRGLSALVQQLKPQGYIKLGLYSEIARRMVVEARDIIQTLGINSTPDEIRAFRRKVLAGEIEKLIELPKSSWDFYSLSECRDLCFHIQEHRYTADKIQRLLNRHRLTFCGFMVSKKIKNLYLKQYPEDSEMTSLANWVEFESEHPSTFVAMYQFWAQKLS